jgi:hypothetical protein
MQYIQKKTGQIGRETFAGHIGGEGYELFEDVPALDSDVWLSGRPFVWFQL